MREINIDTINKAEFLFKKKLDCLSFFLLHYLSEFFRKIYAVFR